MEDNQIQKEIQSQNQLSNDEIISWGQLLSEAKDTLTKANVPDADIDAWLLMEHCFSITKSFFFLNRRQIVESKEKIKQYREFIKQRAARIPLQYLTKTQGFMGLEFSVTPAVLIPRQDTETLVETVLSYAKDKPGASLVDVCTGSGCIASNRYVPVSDPDSYANSYAACHYPANVLLAWYNWRIYNR